MARRRGPADSATRRMRAAARVLSLTCGLFWTCFGLVAGIGERLSPMGVVAHTAVPGLMLLISAAIAWPCEAIGGLLLLAEGVAVSVGIPGVWRGVLPGAIGLGRPPRPADGFVLLALAAPPVVSGLLLLASRWRTRPAATATTAPASSRR